MKRVVCNENYCIGCKLCSVYCITSHSRYKDPVRAFKRQGLSGEERNRLRELGHVSVTQRCQHCSDPLCVQACLTGALYKDKDGAVLHDEDKCAVCGTCMVVCPVGGLTRNGGKGLIRKCDLCRDTDEPACVANCPNGALKVVEE
ncbi:MAG: 4Fe-4S dicluster domain-containing protein [bacterium]|nr:4Fe-4S dicluster domain-containing protein [bacterium]